MRILAVSHFYPPIRAGGYAQLCEEVCQGLQRRGHEVEVLTSRYGATGLEDEPDIHRLLFLENDLVAYSARHFFTRWIYEEYSNDRIIARMLEQINPDVVFIWGIYGLSHSIPAFIECSWEGPIVYFISDHWPADPSFNEMFWQYQAKSERYALLRKLGNSFARFVQSLRNYPPQLMFENAIIVSEAVQRNLLEAGVPLENSIVIRSGVNVDVYHHERRISSSRESVSILYAGNLGAHKGVHTVVEACAVLHDQYGVDNFTLTIIGSGHPVYEAMLSDLIAELGVGDLVRMEGRVPREQMPLILREYDVLVLPSNCEDALPRIVQEAMLSGMAVIASSRGGIPEMITSGETGLLFEAEDSQELAACLDRLIVNQELIDLYGKKGQQRAMAEFDRKGSIDRIESYLQACVS